MRLFGQRNERYNAIRYGNRKPWILSIICAKGNSHPSFQKKIKKKVCEKKGKSKKNRKKKEKKRNL